MLRIVDAGLAACILLLPLIMGGRQALGELVLSVLAIGSSLVWVFHQLKSGKATWRWSSLEWLFVAGTLLLSLQFIPLPPKVLAWLAPKTAQILPLWSSQAQSGAALGAWPCVSLAPSETRAGLMTLIAYCLLFSVTVQRVRKTGDIERLLRWCALSAALMAVFGIVQFLASNGKFFWFYQHPYSTTDDVAKGSFVNRNHFADFLALGVGPLIWWVQRAVRRQQRDSAAKLMQSSSESQLGELLPSVGVIALGLVLFACLLSLSRGGMMAMLVGTVIAALVCYRASALSSRFVMSFVAAVVLVAASLAIFGYDRVERRLSDLPSGSFEQMDHGAGRRTIWAAVTKAIPDFLASGAGVGSLRDIYPQYLDAPTGPDYYTHAENGPLQILLETGVPGTLLLVIVIGFCAFWCLDGLRRTQDSREMVCLGAVLAALAASLAHSMVDFNWYCPACTVILAILAACGCRLWQLASEQAEPSRRLMPVPKGLAVAACGLLLAVGGWMLSCRVSAVIAEGHWYQVRLMDMTAATQPDSTEPSADSSSQPSVSPSGTSPAATPPHSASPVGDNLVATDAKELDELVELVRWQPDHARAHLRIAAIFLRQFHRLQQQCPNDMPLSQIREAAFAARHTSKNPLDSRAALDAWMRRAFGDHCRYLDLALEHAHEALMSAPLVAEGYLYLGELCFLEGGGPETQKAYLAQALKLQPYDPVVLFSAGTNACLAGDFQQGLDYLRASFHAGEDCQEQIFNWLAGRAPPEGRQAEIQFLIEYFQPDYEALKALDRRYAQIARPDELIGLHRHFAQVAEAEASKCDPGTARAGAIWLMAHTLYDDLGDYARATACAQNAVRADPNNYTLRHRLGMYYLKMQQYDDAKRHLLWCLGRRPHDENLRSRVNEAERLRIAQQTPGLMPLVGPAATMPGAAIPSGAPVAAGNATPQANMLDQQIAATLATATPPGPAVAPSSPSPQQPSISLGYLLPPKQASPLPGSALPPNGPVPPGSTSAAGTVVPTQGTVPQTAVLTPGSTATPAYVR